MPWMMHSNNRPEGVKWPPYSLPPNYTPPLVTEFPNNDPPHSTIDQQKPIQSSESDQIAQETSQTQPTCPAFLPYPFPPYYIPSQNTSQETNPSMLIPTFDPRNTFQPQIPHMNTYGNPSTLFIPPISMATHQSQNPPIGDSQPKEKLQILEERLRAIEGERVEGGMRNGKITRNAAGAFSSRKPLLGIGKKKEGEAHAVMMIQGWAEIRRSNDEEMQCGIYYNVRHSIEECNKFKQILQGMIDEQLVQISYTQIPMSISSIGEQAIVVPKPLEVRYAKNAHIPIPYRLKPITVQVPTPFMNKNTKMVPWRYDALLGDDSQNDHSGVPGSSITPAITNISGIGGMTRSGRVYTPEMLQRGQPKEVIANVNYVREGAQIIKPRLSSTSMMVAITMLDEGYQSNQGFGIFLNRFSKLPCLSEKKDRYELGYRPTKADKKRFAEEKKEKRMARLENREPKTERIPICHILQSFRSAGLLFEDQVATIGDRNDSDADLDAKWVIPCLREIELTNWDIIEFPMKFKAESK
ncbi:hypothetical protein SESBI_48134 [Sesbania bispinosa]|nr:hypothetical protein SESBI_48134 [Sesbania bispinosa]